MRLEFTSQVYLWEVGGTLKLAGEHPEMFAAGSFCLCTYRQSDARQHSQL